MSDDVLAAMGISGFGKASKKKQLDPMRFDKNKRDDIVMGEAPEKSVAPSGPAQGPSAGPQSRSASPTPGPSTQQDDKQQEDADEPEYDPEEEYADDAPQFPITHEIILKDHTKVVSALTLDPSGARVLSGSHDYDCKLWDFGGMDMRCKPFKSWEPAGTYYVHDAKYSLDGQRFLVASGTTQARLFDRDGEEKAAFIKGDPYIRDMKHTSGHVSEISTISWHPKEANTFITSSADSTIRIWDVENKRKQKSVIVVKSKERGARTKVTAAAYSPDGKTIGGACLDGAIHMWNTSSNFVRPNMTIEGAHTKGSETGSLSFSVDGRTVLTRAMDDTVKLWDLRAFKKPLATRTAVSTLYPQTNATFSPDEKYIVTGSAAATKGGRGQLLFLDRSNLDVVKTLPVNATPAKVVWHTRINQILVGLSNGEIQVLYSPTTSLNGAKLLSNKGPPRKVTVEDMSDMVSAPTILTPHALPMFRDGDGIIRGQKRKAEQGKQDPRKSMRPEMPITGPGKGGRVGASATQHVVQNLVRDSTRDEDVSPRFFCQTVILICGSQPREALLKYAEAGSKDPQWTAAWSVNQPKPVFADVRRKSPTRKNSYIFVWLSVVLARARVWQDKQA
ncbi:transcription factor [Schizophyllum amplum]|uniref:Transcription factor n=1 Tax=Schizophyllum amplum TaxID=97359 RepID=A0A550C9G3_9AGAR|nr:transcription factor [Auriculariopsis ampla]